MIYFSTHNLINISLPDRISKSTFGTFGDWGLFRVAHCTALNVEVTATATQSKGTEAIAFRYLFCFFVFWFDIFKLKQNNS